MVMMFICQFGMHSNVQQGHRHANMYKQTYDASCSAFRVSTAITSHYCHTNTTAASGNCSEGKSVATNDRKSKPTSVHHKAAEQADSICARLEHTSCVVTTSHL